MVKTLATPLLDEVRLAREARQLADQFPGQTLTRAQLQALTQAHGIDLATRVQYESLIQANRDFIEIIDRIPTNPRPSTTKLKLLIVPALLYKERPEFGGDGKAIADIAQACGFETEILQVLSKGSCMDNATLLWQALEKEQAELVILLSMSKGGAEVRLALEAHREDSAIKKVRAWVNLCGFVRGSPHSDQALGSTWLKFRVWLLCLVIGADFRMVQELATDNPRWLQPFALPEELMVINLMGIPLLSHIQQRNQYNRYVRLMSQGPNDGFTYLSDMIVPGSFTYPLWGADHYFRTPQVSPLLYRVFGYIQDKFG